MLGLDMCLPPKKKKQKQNKQNNLHVINVSLSNLSVCCWSGNQSCMYPASLSMTAEIGFWLWTENSEAGPEDG